MALTPKQAANLSRKQSLLARRDRPTDGIEERYAAIDRVNERKRMRLKRRRHETSYSQCDPDTDAGRVAGVDYPDGLRDVTCDLCGANIAPTERVDYINGTTICIGCWRAGGK